MKPNDQAYQAALRATSDSCSAYQIQNALDAAYAAQFPPSEDYAGLVKELRERAGSYDIQDWHREIELKAADALEAVLVERDAERERLKYFGVLHRQEYDRICSERDALKAELIDYKDAAFREKGERR